MISIINISDSEDAESTVSQCAMTMGQCSLVHPHPKPNGSQLVNYNFMMWKRFTKFTYFAIASLNIDNVIQLHPFSRLLLLTTVTKLFSALGIISFPPLIALVPVTQAQRHSFEKRQLMTDMSALPLPEPFLRDGHRDGA